MQKVEIYYDGMLEAKQDMNKHIIQGWRVHTCTMSCYTAGYYVKERVLVVYEK